MSIFTSNKFYGVIGNGHTCALINPVGEIEWFCIPRFDSGFVFGKIIDDKSGFWSITSDLSPISTYSQNYMKDTAILETHAYNGKNKEIYSITDWMPWNTKEVRRTIQNHASVTNNEYNLTLKPTFDYRRQEHIWNVQKHTANKLTYSVFSAESKDSSIKIMIAEDNIKDTNYVDDALHVTISIMNKCDILLLFDSEISDSILTSFKSREETKEFWWNWLKTSKYHGIYRDEFRRSLITMKLMTYDPTGSNVAAVTSSIPQHLGGGGNWDYRFFWVRDGVYGAASYIDADFVNESRKCLEFLFSVMAPSGTKPWQPLYKIDGDTDCSEQILDHLSGFYGDGPVRIGNLAYLQIQNDLEGEVLDALWLFYEKTHDKSILENNWDKILTITDYVENHWHDEDSGIWELRDMFGHYIHSKVMCWTVFNRAIKISEVLGHTDQIKKWENLSRIIHEDVMANGWNNKIHTFPLAYNVPITDSASLQVPLCGFIDFNDEYNVKMIKRMEKDVVYDHQVARNLFETGPFPLVTFWLARVYIGMGEIEKAEKVISNTIGSVTDLGLYCEQSLSQENQPNPSFSTKLWGFIHLITAHKNFKSFKYMYGMLKKFYQRSYNHKAGFPTPKVSTEENSLFRGNFPQLYSHEELIRALVWLENVNNYKK